MQDSRSELLRKGSLTGFFEAYVDLYGTSGPARVHRNVVFFEFWVCELRFRVCRLEV